MPEKVRSVRTLFRALPAGKTVERFSELPELRLDLTKTALLFIVKAMSDGSPSAVLCADDDKCMCFC